MMKKTIICMSFYCWLSAASDERTPLLQRGSLQVTPSAATSSHGAIEQDGLDLSPEGKRIYDRINEFKDLGYAHHNLNEHHRAIYNAQWAAKNDRYRALRMLAARALDEDWPVEERQVINLYIKQDDAQEQSKKESVLSQLFGM